MTPTIRPAEAADAEPLATLKLRCFRQTFIEGFAIPYPPDALAQFEAESYAPAAVGAELVDAARRTWIAETGGRMVGYAQVGPCKLPHSEVRPGQGELYQLYLLDEAQGLGLGTRLLAEALDHLVATRAGPVWLGVWSGNHRAQAFYRAHGFAHVGGYAFPVGREWTDDEYIFRRDRAGPSARV